MRRRTGGILRSGALAVCLIAGPVAQAACPALPAPEPRGHSGGFDPARIKSARRPPPRPTRPVAVPDGPPGTIRIVMGRTDCLGECPIYTVDICGDGTGVYRGERYVLVEGEHPFTVPPATVLCLVEGFRAADFWSLAPDWRTHSQYEAVVSLRLEIGGQARTLTEENGALVGLPEAVGRIEAAIDAAGAARFVQGDNGTVAALRAEGFDFHGRAAATLLVRAANAAPDRVALDLVAAGAPVNQAVLNIDNLSGRTAVETAARRGRLDLVRALIAVGAFVDAPYRTREAALVAAAEGVHPEVVAELLKGGVQADAPDGEGRFALLNVGSGIDADRDLAQYAARRIEVVRLLLAAGADPRRTDNSGRTPLHRAGSAAEARGLLAAGASLAARDTEGETPLLATFDDDVAVALLEAGADAAARKNDGENIMKAAKAGGLPRTLAWLRAHGVPAPEPFPIRMKHRIGRERL